MLTVGRARRQRTIRTSSGRRRQHGYQVELLGAVVAGDVDVPRAVEGQSAGSNELPHPGTHAPLTEEPPSGSKTWIQLLPLSAT